MPKKSKCIVLRHIEYETHLRLTATISEYLVRNHLDPKIIHSDSIQNFLSLFWCPFGKDYIRFEVFNSYDIHNYTQKIYTAFNNNYNIIDTTREYTIRTIIIKLVSHIKYAIDYCNSTKKVIPSWTDTDYAEAADFFRNEYIVIEKIPTPEGFEFNSCIEFVSASDKKNFYDNIRTMYSYISCRKDMPLYLARKRLYKKFR